MRFLVLVIALSCAGCASYRTPGGPAHLADINPAEVAAAGSLKPSPHFPATIALVQVQAPHYESYSSKSFGDGSFSIITPPESTAKEQLKIFENWPSVAGVVPLDISLLPTKLASLNDLRLTAAKLQADVLLVYTIDTSLEVQNKLVLPLTTVPLDGAPDQAANIKSTASAVFIDVRSGFTYGASEATVKVSDLVTAWGSSEAVDKKRVEAEQHAFRELATKAEKIWAGLAQQYQ